MLQAEYVGVVIADCYRIKEAQGLLPGGFLVGRGGRNGEILLFVAWALGCRRNVA